MEKGQFKFLRRRKKLVREREKSCEG